ncbi:MAG TPA: hypothetical protein VKQ29_08400 [Aliidongia sp.]|nr:hypothetical protein [Aliidongia sp.]
MAPQLFGEAEQASLFFASDDTDAGLDRAIQRLMRSSCALVQLLAELGQFIRGNADRGIERLDGGLSIGLCLREVGARLVEDICGEFADALANSQISPAEVAYPINFRPMEPKRLITSFITS